jgi:hypothetical protein
MRRSALLFPFLFALSFSCTTAPAAAQEVSTIHGVAIESDAVDVRGTIDGTRASFRLRSESGCARDVRLPAITSGRTFTLALDEANLETALGCAIDVEVDDELVDPIGVSPDATVLASSPSLSLDGFALVSTNLERRAGDAVRVTVVSADVARRASITFGNEPLFATVVREDEGSSVLFEIPARDWARAVLERATIHVDVTTADGVRAMDLRPSARVESLADSFAESPQGGANGYDG